MINAERAVGRRQVQAHVRRTDKVATNTVAVRMRRLRSGSETARVS
jgi:hypothetical protein